MVVKSGRKIIGFGLVEVGDSKNGWDANVGSRVLYNLCGALLASQGKRIRGESIVLYRDEMKSLSKILAEYLQETI